MRQEVYEFGTEREIERENERKRERKKERGGRTTKRKRKGNHDRSSRAAKKVAQLPQLWRPWNPEGCLVKWALLPGDMSQAAWPFPKVSQYSVCRVIS